jgi:hypothetical protein
LPSYSPKLTNHNIFSYPVMHFYTVFSAQWFSTIRSVSFPCTDEAGNVYNVTLRRIRVTNLAVATKHVFNIECVSAFLSHLSSREITYFLRRITLSCVGCLPLPNFSTLSHNGHDFRKKIINMKCVLIFCTRFCFWNISHSMKNSESSCKVPVMLDRF